MNKEKEIEEMANICYANKREWSGKSQGFCYVQAEALANAGYGNVKQAVKEFSIRLIALYEDDKEDGVNYSTPCAVIVQNIKDIQDEFLTELYGADE